ncbi:c-type cytochrome [Acetobacter tropicalis]|uniref:Cytochrome c-1 n=1 Tax=Acetobacter tropicalis TaxID=104102 RepID=A0A094ZFK2_9PROT|nr:c-type cytochrome [Acetobacter tropicalis]KAA8389561.1 c-type cytochrome [Acetobacter tropicalis]KAA8390518.1 c-type cytochrome [Acetobacter tropicalis]KGB21361.1 cytochrome c-1 [Acetobacter tropicalis]MBC9008513.1 c-type cytochrome [Acetobacter tropicalis]MDO8170208.1 c-type cytochrome [Acetobacter tropicalis]
MDSVFLNKAAAAVLLSIATAWICGAVGSTVVPITAPAKPAFSVPGTENVPIAPYMAHADADHGEELAHQICSSCHALVSAASDGVGPNLAGVAGRPRASITGYAYSSALAGQKAHVWSDQALSDWLTSPARFAPGTRMSLVGISSPAQRADIIAYLHTLAE